MTDEERDAVQKLVSAAIRVVRTPMTGVALDSPMARAVFGLALQLAAAGFITIREAQDAGNSVSPEGMDEVMGQQIEQAKG